MGATMPRHKSKPLTPEQREAIREVYIAKQATMAQLASQYSVSISVIHRAVHSQLVST